ncbi:Iojap protein [uncultured Candidatus Thioglobus sp.]|nr:Iojap protein [uncultured Candidatus Thioglobus sp.]
MQLDTLTEFIIAELTDNKASDIQTLDVRGRVSFTDLMIIASGRSRPHIVSIVENLMVKSKQKGVKLYSVEGQEYGEWGVLDFGDIIVHIMRTGTREYYKLEQLWSGAEDMAETSI